MSVGKVDAIQDNDVPNDRIDGYLPLEWKDIHAALRISAGFPSEREGWRFFECPDRASLRSVTRCSLEPAHRIAASGSRLAAATSSTSLFL